MCPEIVVEIGGAGAPIREIKRDASPTKKYAGIDKDESAIRHRSGCEAVGDLCSLPLRSDLADEIWLMNVFGEICLQDRDFVRPFRLRDGRMVFDNGAKKCFLELARVLKSQGSIYVGELYDPLYPSYMLDYDFCEFGLEKTVYSGLDAVEFAKNHGLMKNDIFARFVGRTVMGAETFFLRLQKI